MTCSVFFATVCFYFGDKAALYSIFSLPDKKIAKKFRCNFKHIPGEKFSFKAGKERKHVIKVIQYFRKNNGAFFLQDLPAKK
jgi:hypothetical protein